jgi:S-adenosylmethionine:tRNA ribosyltransferase-isomerase
MTDPRTLSIKDFTYSLPEDRIAEYPLPERDASKLLIYNEGNINETTYWNIAAHLPADSLLVFNDTRVIEARLLFQKPTGGIIEIFCLEPHQQYADITTAMMQQRSVLWKCLIGGASKWKHGQILEKLIIQNTNKSVLKAKFIEKTKSDFTVEFSWSDPSLIFAEILHLAGAIPLPPYIKRKADPDDTERYQTIYANQDGSVAAPTAGLHFTEKVFESLKTKNILKEFVTLHVGAGTFMPVKSDTMQNHDMHAEYFTVSKKTIERLLIHADQKIITVGTTSLRTIESLYWLGVKSLSDDTSLQNTISQWEVYDFRQNIPVSEALASLLRQMEKNHVHHITAKTQIIIAPGYRFRIVKGLITNFHQPQSTLLLLVSAFIGDDWRKVYHYALENNYRFLSYGDGNLYWLNQA